MVFGQMVLLFMPNLAKIASQWDEEFVVAASDVRFCKNRASYSMSDKTMAFLVEMCTYGAVCSKNDFISPVGFASMIWSDDVHLMSQALCSPI